MKPEPLKGAADASTPKDGDDAIRDFYTRHPYPPPLENLDRAIDMWQDLNVHRAEFHLLWPHKEYHPDLDVLIASSARPSATLRRRRDKAYGRVEAALGAPRVRSLRLNRGFNDRRSVQILCR